MSEADALADKIEDLIAEFGHDPVGALQCISEYLDLRNHEKRLALNRDIRAFGHDIKISTDGDRPPKPRA